MLFEKVPIRTMDPEETVVSCLALSKPNLRPSLASVGTLSLSTGPPIEEIRTEVCLLSYCNYRDGGPSPFVLRTPLLLPTLLRRLYSILRPHSIRDICYWERGSPLSILYSPK